MPGCLATMGAGSFPFTPTQVANLTGWYMAESIGQGDNTAVSSWADSSGNANNLAQATATNQPTYQTAELNGRDAVLFDGVDNFMNVSGLAGAADMTIFVVCKPQTVGGITRCPASCGTSEQAINMSTTGLVNLFAGASVSSGITLVDETAYVLVAQFNQAASFLRANGSQSANINPGSNSSTVQVVGRNGGGANYFHGPIGEALFYARALTTDEIASVENYLRGRWGI